MSAIATQNPSFLALHPSNLYLYCVNELSPRGAVTSFSLDLSTGELVWLNEQASEGDGPCHLCCDPSGRVVVVANHGDGVIATLPVLSSGQLLEASDIQTLDGKRAKAHYAGFDPSGRFVLAVDKGTNRVLMYRIDREAACLHPGSMPSISTHSAAKPRHLAFEPSGRFAFVNGEADMSVTVFSWDPTIGAMDRLERCATLPPNGSRKGFTTSEIGCHPRGDRLYVANRGHNSLAVFEIERATGRLSPLEFPWCGGENPRHFAFDLQGRFLYVANQDTNQVAVFEVDEAGIPQLVGAEDVASPACILFVETGLN